MLGELQAQGIAGQAIIRKLVVDMAGLGKPMDDCQDPVQGAEALRRLRELAIKRRAVVDVEQQAVEARRNRKRLSDRAREQEACRHDELKERFRALSAPSGDAQRRGYDFEHLYAARS